MIDKNYKLDYREEKVLKLRFGLDNNFPFAVSVGRKIDDKEIKSLELISCEIGRTRERIRQIQKNAIQKLMNMYQNNNSSIDAGDQLTKIENKILTMRSGIDGNKIMSIPMVKDETDCTREQILQHYKNAIQKLVNIYDNQTEEKG